MTTTVRAALAAVLGAGALTLVSGAAPGSAATVPPMRCTAGETQYVTDDRARANLDQLGFPESWRFATGRKQVVAVVDSGVDTGNQHFDGAVLAGKSFVSGPATVDETGHGTAIAGIIAARKIKRSVHEGGAPGAEILPVRVLQDPADTDTGTVAKGIRWAAEQGADVINVSISTGPSDGDLDALRSAVDFARSKDAVVVAAAGNARSGDEPYTQMQFPAGLKGVVGVAAANPAGDVDNWSIHGRHVDVTAPGANVLTSFRANGDCLVGLDHAFSSYATAYVSAVAAQLREAFPDDSAPEIANRLMATADRPRQRSRDDEQGWGLVQPLAALTSDSAAPPNRPASSTAQSSGRGFRPSASSGAVADPARTPLLWWALATSALLAMALIARPLTVRIRAFGR